LTFLLLVLAAVVVVATLGGLVSIGYECLLAERIPASRAVFQALRLLVGGMGAAGIMLGLAAVIHYVRRLTLALEPAKGNNPSAPGGGNAAPVTMVPLDVPNATAGTQSRVGSEVEEEMLRLLREINDNSLLSEDQKRAKWERRCKEERQAAIDRVEALARQGDFPLAFRICRELTDRHGQDDQIDSLAKRVEQARAAAEAKDVADARQKVRDLMSISAWERAEAIATDLVQKHPRSDEARQLPDLIVRERQTFEQQQRRRIFADIEKHTIRRQWKEALVAARMLVDRHNGSPEAQAVLPKLQTLEANAEIQERQTLETQIKDLVKRHRFDEAATLARHVIQTYPDSPQADVLRSQLPRLEEKAKQQG